jgi:hypothetical protein
MDYKFSVKSLAIGLNDNILRFLEAVKKNEACLSEEDKEALADLVAEVMEELSYLKKAYLGK